MKRRLSLLPLIIAVTLTGCNSLKNKDAFYATNNLDKTVIQLNPFSMEYMVKEKYSFSVLLYTDQCSYCDTAKENLYKCQEEISYSLYKLEIYNSSLKYLKEKLPDLFNELSYPLLYIFNEGQLTYKSEYSDLSNLASLKKLINAYHLDSNIYTTNETKRFNSFIKNKRDFLLYTYDSKVLDEKDIYSNCLFPLAKQSSKNTLILDKNTANEELFEEILEKYKINQSQFVIFENAQIKTAIDYSSISGEEINNLLVSFYN